MKFRVFPVILLALVLIPFTVGCAKKTDSKRPIEKIQKEVVSMSLPELESRAVSYAAAIRVQNDEIEKIQKKIQKMPMDQVFNNKSMTRRIADIGREGDALFERYRIYAMAFQEKGGDPSKIQLEPSQK